jgi:hypothetical protein
MLRLVPAPTAFQVTCWAVWAGTAATCAAASLGVIALVLSRARLRAQPLNHYVVSAALPDLLFCGLNAIACALHASHGSRGWHDSAAIGDGDRRRRVGGDEEWMCDVQAFCVVFGAAGSLWST